eukprot:m.336988 g.336988  ORF g.336988 m.336988 type:complete len:348 (-) comp18016_c0_seq1:167-1210(-)
MAQAEVDKTPTTPVCASMTGSEQKSTIVHVPLVLGNAVVGTVDWDLADGDDDMTFLAKGYANKEDKLRHMIAEAVDFPNIRSMQVLVRGRALEDPGAWDMIMKHEVPVTVVPLARAGRSATGATPKAVHLKGGDVSAMGIGAAKDLIEQLAKQGANVSVNVVMPDGAKREIHLGPDEISSLFEGKHGNVLTTGENKNGRSEDHDQKHARQRSKRQRFLFREDMTAEEKKAFYEVQDKIKEQIKEKERRAQDNKATSRKLEQLREKRERKKARAAVTRRRRRGSSSTNSEANSNSTTMTNSAIPLDKKASVKQTQGTTLLTPGPTKKLEPKKKSTTVGFGGFKRGFLL